MANDDGDRESAPPTRPLPAPIPPQVAVRYLDGAWPGVMAPGRNLPDSAVLSGVVNDLRGPITDLLTSASLLADNLEALPPATRSVVQLIQWRSLLLQSRSENLSCAAAVWDGRFQIHPQRVDLLEIIHEVRLAVEPALGQRGRGLEIIGDGGDVYADARRFAQTLVNLILNARQHGGERDSIAVRLSARDANLRVAVVDRGSGIARERVPGLFELIHQPLSSIASGRITLGLAVVRAIAEAHGGRVGARNRRGGGACVWFELPGIVGPAGGATIAATPS